MSAADRMSRKGAEVQIEYTNWKDNRSLYTIYPAEVRFGNNEFHQEPQWLLKAWIMRDGKLVCREFAMKDIHSWTPVP